MTLLYLSCLCDESIAQILLYLMLLRNTGKADGVIPVQREEINCTQSIDINELAVSGILN